MAFFFFDFGLDIFCYIHIGSQFIYEHINVKAMAFQIKPFFEDGINKALSTVEDQSDKFPLSFSSKPVYLQILSVSLFY